MLDAIRSKASTMRIKKQTEKETNVVRYWWKSMLKVLTGEASKGYKQGK